MDRNLSERLYIATVCGQHREIVKRYGIGAELDQFCSAVNMEGENRRRADAEIRPLIDLSAGKKPILHAPFNELFPAAIDPKARGLAMERLNSAASLAVQYDAEKMVVHSGYMPFVYFKEWHIDRSVEFWQEFMADKKPAFRIVIENVLEDEPYMMANMMQKIEDDRIRLCLDVGHANCISAVPVWEWLKVTAPYLGHLHIHNNDGSHDYHKPLTEGSIDMGRFLEKAVELCREDATVTIESLDGLASMEWLGENGFLQSPEPVQKEQSGGQNRGHSGRE